MIDLPATLSSMLAAVSGASCADEAWKAVASAGKKKGGVIPDDICGANAEGETQIVARQLRGILERNPPPPNLTFLYFGLFPAAVSETSEETAGFYVAGGESSEAEPVLDGLDDLTWFPRDEYFDSPLLQRVKTEALRGGDDYNFYDYALMFGAAALLAKFAMRELRLDHTLLVGFDSGDVALVAL